MNPASRTFNLTVNGNLETVTACPEWTGMTMKEKERYLNDLFWVAVWAWV
jgi:hypothetical protein